MCLILSKMFFASVLIAFVCIQHASSLSCYKCSTPNDCKKAQKVTCTNSLANETSYYLGVYHSNVPNVTSSSSFQCLKLLYTYAQNTTVTNQLHGCVHPNANACSLSLKPEYQAQSWIKRTCNLCTSNNCNKSPAAKTSSSFYTILFSAMALILFKVSS